MLKGKREREREEELNDVEEITKNPVGILVLNFKIIK